MTQPVPDGASSWAEIPWAKIPARFRELPEQWPRPLPPTARRLSWWRWGTAVTSVLVIGMAVTMLVLPLDPAEAPVLRQIALWAAFPLVALFATVNVLVERRPYFPRSWQVEELQRKTLRQRREVFRALRHRRSIPDDRVALTRFWIAQTRVGSRIIGWLGLMYTAQAVLSAWQSSWLVTVWLALITLWLGLAAYNASLERAFRSWEAGRGPSDGAGPEAMP